MNIKDLKHFIREIQLLFKHHSLSKDDAYREQRMQYSIIMAAHGVEKGLSFDNVHLSFGVSRIMHLMQMVADYYRAGYDCSHECIAIAMGAMNSYVVFHQERDALDPRVAEYFAKLQKMIPDVDVNRGGYLCLDRDDVLDFHNAEFEKILLSRHSVRTFDKSVSLDYNAVERAVELANHCPCACNRQTTHTYIIREKELFDHIASALEGAGGFADGCSAILLITGNVSAFSYDESNQWIVNGGIFIGNLCLALHSFGIASCVLRRTLVRSKDVMQLRDIVGIPDNEEIISAVCIGAYPEHFKAPMSTRVSVDKLITYK